MRFKFLVGFLFLPFLAMGQRFIYDVDFMTYFDNREYHVPYTPSQTLFGLRLTPTVGVAFTDSLGGQHALRGGVTYIQPFGAKMNDARLFPTIYYQYRQMGFTVNLGTIPYTELENRLPSFLRSDSLQFFYPNIQGALLGYQSEKGYAQFFCDWRGLQSKHTREAFRLVLMGQYHYKWFYTGGIVSMNHLANKATTEPRLGVCDDGLINPFVGVNLTDYIPLDTFSIQTGYLGGYYTDRHENEQSIASGFLCDVNLRWRFLGLENSFYVGQRQMPYYEKFGSTLYQGSPFYCARLYNRTDLMAYLIRRPFVVCYFSWNFHWVQAHGVSNQQQLVLRFNLSKLKSSDKLLKI